MLFTHEERLLYYLLLIPVSVSVHPSESCAAIGSEVMAACRANMG